MTNPTRTRDYVQFLVAHGDQEKPHYLHHLQDLSQATMDAVMLEIYQAIIGMFDAYPKIARIAPSWEGEISQEDRTFTVQFYALVSSKSDAVAWPGGNRPAWMEDRDPVAFDRLIKAGQMIDPAFWNDFLASELADNQCFFTDADQVRAHMQEALGSFVSLHEQWLITQQTSDSPAMKKPTGRF